MSGPDNYDWDDTSGLLCNECGRYSIQLDMDTAKCAEDLSYIVVKGECSHCAQTALYGLTLDENSAA